MFSKGKSWFIHCHGTLYQRKKIFLQLIFILGFWIADIRILIIIFIAALTALITWIIISLINGFDTKRPLPFGTFLSISSIAIYPFKMDFLLF